jgi:uncharacterized membrane protein YkoI
MKSLVLSLVLSAGIACGVAADRITWVELPDPVKQAVMKEDHGEIRRLERDVQNGQTLYNVEYDFRTRNKVATFRQDGTLVRETQVVWSSVPRPVQRAILDQGQGNPREITLEARYGQPVYHVQFPGAEEPFLFSPSGHLVGRGEPGGLRIPTSAVISRPAPGIPSRIPSQKAPPHKPMPQVGQQPGLTATLQNARHITFAELPPEAQRSVQTQTVGAKIENIQAGTLHGRPVYQVTFRDREGESNVLRVGEDGSFLQRLAAAELQDQTDWDPRAWGGFTLPLSEGRHVTWEQVPPAAQKAIRSFAGDARIENINRGTLLGMTAYQAAFKPDGVHHELRVAEDGSFLEQSSDGQVIAQSPLLRNRMAFLRNLPRPAQEAIQEQAGTSMIRAVQDQIHDGERVYRVAIEEQGRQAEFLVARDGRVVQGAIREAAGAQPGDMTRKVTFEQLPPAVQQTVRTQVDVNRIEDIDERRRGGQTTYEVGYKRHDGTHVEMLLDQSGRVLRIDEE